MTHDWQPAVITRILIQVRPSRQCFGVYPLRTRVYTIPWLAHLASGNSKSIISCIGLPVRPKLTSFPSFSRLLCIDQVCGTEISSAAVNLIPTTRSRALGLPNILHIGRFLLSFVPVATSALFLHFYELSCQFSSVLQHANPASPHGSAHLTRTYLMESLLLI